MGELTRLGRYQLKQVLGRGAMGVVYEGLDPSLNRRVAVKTILKNAAIDAETARGYSAQFAREAQAAGRLNHPNIVQVHDFAEEGDVAYLVMEYIQGRELRSYFEAKEKFDVAETVRIMGELLDALQFAHEAGVIHRDVKPANVMLDAQRRVKLADFGVARIQDSERSAAGTMVGTPAFMSPEQIQGLKIDRRTDIFSAGTILYQLLTGDQPFIGQGAWTVAKKIMEDRPPQPSSLVQSVSPAFDAIVDKALAKKAADRYASAKEFAAALRATVAPAQMSLPPATPAIAAPKSKAAPQASETELEFWRAIQNSTDAAEFEFYLEQFPEGTYAGLARHKIARLSKPPVPDAQDTVRLEAEAQAKLREAAEQAKRQAAAEQSQRQAAEEQAKRELVEKTLRESAERARREAEEKTRREAAERAQRVAEEKAKYEAAAKAKREVEEKARQAAALARLKQEEASARAKPVADEDATIAMPARRPAPAPQVDLPQRRTELPPPAKTKSLAIPAAIAAVVIGGAIAAYLFTGRAPAPVASPTKPEAAPAPAVDVDKIRRDTEERLRKEYADKAAAERAALEKAVVEKLSAERAAAEKVAQAKNATEKAAAEKVAAAAVAARLAAEKSAAEKASVEKANAEKAIAERAAAERAAAEKLAAEKAAAERVAAEKLAAEKAATEKAAAEKLAAAKPAADSHEAKLERFIGRVGREKVLKEEPPLGSIMNQSGGLQDGEVVYVNDGACPPGRIRQVTGTSSGGGNLRGRPSRCISLDEGGSAAAKSPAAKPVAPVPSAAAPAAAAPGGSSDAQLERFIQRKGRDKVLLQEPQAGGMADPIAFGEVAYINDGSCPPGRIREVKGVATDIGSRFRPTQRPSRCISLAD